MSTKFKITFIAINLLFCFSANSQDLNFSQFYELPLLRNPALAGLFKGDIRATAAFRSQWGSVTTPYVSQALGIDTKFSIKSGSDNYIAIGLQITNDIAGDSRLGKTQLLPVLTFHKSLNSENDTYLSLGFMGGFVQQRFDVTKLSFDDQFVNGAYSSANPTKQTFSNTNVTYLDGAIGLVFSSILAQDVKYYFGASYFHFGRPKVAFDQSQDIKLNQKLMINAGMSIPTSDNDRVILYGDFFTQGGNRQMQGGFMYQHDLLQEDEENAISLSAGTFLRWNDAVVPVLKLDYYHLAAGLTYDVNISKLTTASQLRGGFEVTLSYRDFLNIKNSSIDKVRCPVSF